MHRLLGNRHLHKEQQRVYRQLGQWLLSQVRRPLIIVDWSDVYEGQQFLMLTASIPMGGRMLTLYEEVYPITQYNSPTAHDRFLRGLAKVAPHHTHRILITDAGFRGPWFRTVEALGWDWVGRLRKNGHVSLDVGNTWQEMASVYRRASYKIQSLGQALLRKKHPYAGHLYVVKKNRKGNRPLKASASPLVCNSCYHLYNWLRFTPN